MNPPGTTSGMGLPGLVDTTRREYGEEEYKGRRVQFSLVQQMDPEEVMQNLQVNVVT